MQKNQVLVDIVSAIGSNMEGIVKTDTHICFVPYALLGEKIKFKVLKVSKNLAFCKLLEVIAPAEERIRPKCSVFEKCGGCQLQHLRYNEQLKLKSKTVSDCIKKIAGVEVKVPNTIKSNYEYEYRLTIPRDGEGKNTNPFDSEKQWGNRMRGKTMQCELKSSSNNLDFSLQYIITKFRTSWT